jgi:hypothetical protein
MAVALTLTAELASIPNASKRKFCCPATWVDELKTYGKVVRRKHNEYGQANRRLKQPVLAIVVIEELTFTARASPSNDGIQKLSSSVGFSITELEVLAACQDVVIDKMGLPLETIIRMRLT